MSLRGGADFEVLKAHVIPSELCIFVIGVQSVSYCSSATPVCLLPCPPPWQSWTLTLWNGRPLIKHDKLPGS